MILVGISVSEFLALRYLIDGGVTADCGLDTAELTALNYRLLGAFDEYYAPISAEHQRPKSACRHSNVRAKRTLDDGTVVALLDDNRWWVASSPTRGIIIGLPIDDPRQNAATKTTLDVA